MWDKISSAFIKQHLAAPSGAAINYDTVPHSQEEGMRNYNIQRNLSQKNFMGNVVTKVELPNDTPQTQMQRNAEWFRQASMPWGSRFMVTPTDAARLNNNPQASFVKQRQLTPPNTYGQFYAFMHALSAAFGTLRG